VEVGIERLADRFDPGDAMTLEDRLQLALRRLYAR
jgi:hypothetical protein